MASSACHCQPKGGQQRQTDDTYHLKIFLKSIHHFGCKGNTF